jgi:hypothetical protein
MKRIPPTNSYSTKSRSRRRRKLSAERGSEVGNRYACVGLAGEEEERRLIDMGRGRGGVLV